jgi:hypothetical protein
LAISIFALLIVLPVSPHLVGSAQETQQAEIEVTRGRIERPTAERVLVWVRISNRRAASIFIPREGPEEQELRFKTLGIEQLNGIGKWKYVGPFGSEIPPNHVFELKAGQSVIVLSGLNKQIPRIFGGGTNDFRGKHRVVLRYYNTLAEWRAWREWLVSESGSGKVPSPKMQTATSAPFEIPAP